MRDPEEAAAIKVLRYAERHSGRWRDRSDLYWYLRLLQETLELGGVVLGLHDDDPEHEKAQIASICINWMDKP